MILCRKENRIIYSALLDDKYQLFFEQKQNVLKKIREVREVGGIDLVVSEAIGEDRRLLKLMEQIHEALPDTIYLYISRYVPHRLDALRRKGLDILHLKGVELDNFQDNVENLLASKE